MPLQRRLPKFGFKNINRVEYKPVNLSDLEALATARNLEKITIADLQAAGLMGKKPVKILANGELTKKLEVEANAFSEAAKQAIEALGGTITKI